MDHAYNLGEEICKRWNAFKKTITMEQAVKITAKLYHCRDKPLKTSSGLGKSGNFQKMYKLGYNNNNCIGCVKGGMGYWNKIRVDFPLHFDRMAKLERQIGYTCLHNDKEGNIYLDELDPKRGRMTKEVMPNCGLVCDVEFADLEDKNLSEVIEGKMTIYEAIAA